jgi:hypothetical protein
MMKTSSISLVLLSFGGASAFAPILPTTTLTSSTTATQLNLFGGGGAKKAGGGGAPNMMDQLAMFKKAQEMASKKKKLDEELSKETFVGTSENGKVTGKFKFVPIQSPMDPNPDIDCIGFDFDSEWYESAAPEDIGTAATEVYKSGVDATNKAMMEKYEVLQNDLMASFGVGQEKPSE